MSVSNTECDILECESIDESKEDVESSKLRVVESKGDRQWGVQIVRT